MDPRSQDCFGFYLYGAGWFARDENTLSLLTGGKTPEHFCQRCPARTDCEAHQRARVRDQQPEVVHEFDQRIRAAPPGVSYLLIEVATAQKGLNPFYNDAMENFKRGHAERGQIAGTLTQGKDPLE